MVDGTSPQSGTHIAFRIAGNVGMSDVAHMIDAGLSYDGSCSVAKPVYIRSSSDVRHISFAIHEVDFDRDGSYSTLNSDIAVIAPVGHEASDVFPALKGGDIAIIADHTGHSAALINEAMAKKLAVMRVSLDDESGTYSQEDIWVEQMVQRADCSCVIAYVAGERVTYKISVPGEQAVLNSLLALAAIKAAGGDLAMAAISFANQQASPGYGCELEFGDEGRIFTLIDYSQGINALSLGAALHHIQCFETGKFSRRTAVLSNFDEALTLDKSYVDTVRKQLVKAGITRVLTTGKSMAALTRSAGIATEEFLSNITLQSRLKALARSGDVALVMGSVSSGFSTIVDRLKMQFDPVDDALKIAAE